MKVTALEAVWLRNKHSVDEFALALQFGALFKLVTLHSTWAVVPATAAAVGLAWLVLLARATILAIGIKPALLAAALVTLLLALPFGTSGCWVLVGLAIALLGVPRAIRWMGRRWSRSG